MNISHSSHSHLLSTVLPSFLEAAKVDRVLTGESLRKYEEAIKRFIRIVGDLPVYQVTVESFQQLKQVLLARGSGPCHINGVIYAVRKLMMYSQQRLGLTIPDLGALRSMKIPRRAVVYLTDAELDQFLASIRINYRNGSVNPFGLCFRTLVEILAGTVMRISEALALDVTTIKWREHEARIIGKGGRERAIYFSERAMRWMRRYLEHRTDRKPALLVSPRTGQRLQRYEAQRMCRIATKRCRLPKRVTLHVLRHTFATTLLRNGCPIGHIQGLLGHERLETTCRYYLGLLSDKDLKKAHERFLEW